MSPLSHGDSARDQLVSMQWLEIVRYTKRFRPRSIFLIALVSFSKASKTDLILSSRRRPCPDETVDFAMAVLQVPYL